MITRRALAIGGIVGQIVFVAGWLLAGTLEGHGYSAARHDISDLGAMTAHHVPLALGTLAVSGALTAAFAIWVLGPSLAVDGRPFRVGAVLVALSLPSLDNISDVFFRLDCRAADAGCSSSRAMASWHGHMHITMFLIALVPTLVAPFMLARRMRVLPAWVDAAGPARVFGFVTLAGFVATAASQGTAVQGLCQRLLATTVVAGIAALAWRVVRLSSREQRVAAPA